MSVSADGPIIAYCGLVCSECGALRKGKCEGCHSDKRMFPKCPVRKCAMEHNFTTCADCDDFGDLKKCKKLHNMISIIVGFLFRTNRIGNLDRIREIGLEKFVEEHSSTA
ncbi:DUF3795 domain-containing protein [Candidatus Hydrogenedentota bacterium]